MRNEIGLILISSPFLVSTFNLCDFNAVVPSELSIFFSPPLQFIEFSFFEPLNFFFQEWPSGNTMEPMLAGIVVLLIVLDPFFFDLLISKCQHERLVEVCPVGLDDLKTLKHDYTPTPQKKHTHKTGWSNSRPKVS